MSGTNNVNTALSERNGLKNNNNGKNEIAMARMK
jgi:hypothetical protein